LLQEYEERQRPDREKERVSQENMHKEKRAMFSSFLDVIKEWKKDK
jgi:hypothetical protein